MLIDGVDSGTTKPHLLRPLKECQLKKRCPAPPTAKNDEKKDGSFCINCSSYCCNSNYLAPFLSSIAFHQALREAVLAVAI